MVLTIRRAEEALAELLAEGLIPGFIHLSIGQEAIAAGVMDVLTPADTITSTHRGHGHAIAKGMELDAFFAELLGATPGPAGGGAGRCMWRIWPRACWALTASSPPACRSRWAARLATRHAEAATPSPSPSSATGRWPRGCCTNA
jgi:TPP-dependent pyruvate/acetoin dehydrogenase alpha subunit